MPDRSGILTSLRETLMNVVIRLLLALELTATVVQEAGPSTHGLLPLGGSNLAQLGIALVLAVLLKDIWDASKEARSVWKDRRRRAQRRKTPQVGIADARLNVKGGPDGPADAKE